MLKEIFNNGYYSFHEGFDDWRDAIRASYIPLLNQKIVNEKYVESVIDCVEEYGPYIVITKNVAMPHSTSNIEGCTKSGMSFMKVNTPVKFDENDREKDATLFFSLAVGDYDEHVKNIQNLMEILVNEKLLNELMSVNDMKMFKEVIDKY